jgi:hypothetical protein
MKNKGRILGWRTDKKTGKRYPIGAKKSVKHLYRNGAKYGERKKFEAEYGKKKGDYVYGAVVGKVRRERGSGGS